MKRLVLTAALALMAMGAFAQNIAVFPFEDMDNVLTRNEAVMFYREFSNEFSNQSAGKFTVVPRQEVEKFINFEMAFQLKDYSAKAKTAEMERVLNGTQILSGLIGKLGNNIRVIVSLYTFPELQQLPGGTSLSVANTTELFNKIPELVQQMQDRIAGPAQPIPEGLLYEVVDRKTVTITKYIGNAVTLTIPSQIEGLPVTSIGERAFFDRDILTSVTIPSAVMSIGKMAFYGCDSLTSITVDNRNTVYASIDGVLFDKNIRTLIQYPMDRNQRAYVIPSSVTSIGYAAFKYCDNLTSITIPSSVTSIGDTAFDGCWNLTSITIPSSVTSIGANAFDACRSLTSVTIPSAVMSIGKMAFYGCDSLTSITVDNRNTVYASIDGVLFDKNIRTLCVYPAGRNQRTYVIPASVTSIGDYAFNGCSSLTSITIPSAVTSIGENAFIGCSSLTSITIPSSVTSIEDWAFNGCSSLTSITIPSAVTSIGYAAFHNCFSLTSITVDNRNPVYASMDGVLFDKNIRSLILYPEGITQRTYVIPSSVTSIEDRAFNSCKSLTSITIPASVTVIGPNAFNYCRNLTSVTLSRRTQVGENAFPETARITYID